MNVLCHFTLTGYIDIFICIIVMIVEYLCSDIINAAPDIAVASCIVPPTYGGGCSRS